MVDKDILDILGTSTPFRRPAPITKVDPTAIVPGERPKMYVFIKILQYDYSIQQTLSKNHIVIFNY